MRYKCLLHDIKDSSFVVLSVSKNEHRQIGYLNDFYKREGYLEVGESEVIAIEKLIGTNWPDLKEMLIKKLTQTITKVVSKLTKSETTETYAEWNSLVEAANKHKGSKYRKDLIPDIINLYSISNNLAPKDSSMAILKEKEEIENKLNKVRTLNIECLRLINTLTGKELETGFNSIIDELNKI